MIQIHDWLNPSPAEGEINVNPSEVLTAGFVPDDLRIKELLLAGNRLEAFRLGEPVIPDYDFEDSDDVPDDYDDPTSEYLDEIEAQEILNQSNRRISASIKAREHQYSRRLREDDSSISSSVNSFNSDDVVEESTKAD